MEVRKLAIAMHLEGVGFRAIGRLLGISNVAVLLWVREAAKALREAQLWHRNHSRPECIELDEMWHFCQKKAPIFGFGLLMIKDPESPSGFSVVIVAPNQDGSSTKK